ncbi:TetR/AcrR family transcriptional regulator (plasmid) [Streptomyces sp. NBC_00435]|uniref:TetR/AcrR family transcriptional regulator n=1 Tax=Streptomyces sp. NBC_00435 TaxID=2903649 RepID=UPI002E238E66
MTKTQQAPRDAADLPPLPWARPAKKVQVRQPLSREAIVDAALALVDKEGLDALSMRRVAQELGTGAASLYAHVANKEELLALLFDRVSGEVLPAAPDPERWQEQIKEFCRDSRRAMLAHRDMARIALGQIPVGPSAIMVLEGMLGILRAGGLSDRAAAYGADVIGNYVSACILEESHGRGDSHSSVEGEGEGEGGDEGGDEGAERDQMEAYFASLPPERFPHLVALAGTLMAGDADERFDFGLDVVVAGLAAHAGRD